MYPCKRCQKPTSAWDICQKCLYAERKAKNTLANAPAVADGPAKKVESGAPTDYHSGVTTEKLPPITGSGHLTIKRPKPKPEG